MTSPAQKLIDRAKEITKKRYEEECLCFDPIEYDDFCMENLERMAQMLEIAVKVLEQYKFFSTYDITTQYSPAAEALVQINKLASGEAG